MCLKAQQPGGGGVCLNGYHYAPVGGLRELVNVLGCLLSATCVGLESVFAQPDPVDVLRSLRELCKLTEYYPCISDNTLDNQRARVTLADALSVRPAFRGRKARRATPLKASE